MFSYFLKAIENRIYSLFYSILFSMLKVLPFFKLERFLQIIISFKYIFMNFKDIVLFYTFILNIVINLIFCKPEHAYIYHVITLFAPKRHSFISEQTYRSILLICTIKPKIKISWIWNFALLCLDTYYFSCRELF